MDRDRFMTAEEALEWGLIDRILTVREGEIPD
jgi:ATP-dependent Clp protease protease subunit